MAEKFAFESDNVSVAFMSHSNALGDVLIAKSVFDAVVKLVPNCKIDVFYAKETAKAYIEAFYGQSKNLNRVIGERSFYAENLKNYDAAFRVWHMVFIDFANVERLRNRAPALFQAVCEIDVYNKKYVYNTDRVGVILRNITRAHILGTNRYTCLSCDGALPIYDNRIEISLSPEAETNFRKLNLSKNYITIGSNSNRNGKIKRHGLKEWSVSHAIEYISLLNRHVPEIEIIQIGGGGYINSRMPTVTYSTRIWNLLNTY